MRKAIAAGINIVHINTELRVAWRHGLEEALTKQPNEVVPYKILPFAVESVKQVVRSRLKLFNFRVDPMFALPENKQGELTVSQHQPTNHTVLDPVIQKMLDELAAEGSPPVYSLTPKQARDTLVDPIPVGARA